MRRQQKKEIYEILEAIKQEHEKIADCMKNGNNPIAMSSLEQCQDIAIQLGEFIEKTEKDTGSTITILEEYCEYVFELHEKLGTNEIQHPVNDRNETKKLEEYLTAIENSIRNDIPVKLEVVFFPYKAAMWDSLESIWMAASADPNCDAYVVPIPYHELHEDRTNAEFHYEGDMYPDYVPIINYKDYSLEDRRPDIAYIHNPYDDTNLVVRVLPEYFSKAVKKYTDCLIYVPYFATAGYMGEGQKLCTAYLYADFIVTQSAKFLKYYDPIIPEEKFLPFGSPKFDRVVRLCNNPPEPPASWKERMRGKKVYFYNTSITGMLADTIQFLHKMKYVFECFQGREDACLIWRPHPLLESTFESMRNEAAPVYRQLRDIYIKGNIGIYDDTVDIEKTIALSDVYIGDDGTSVTSLFGIAGKPMFIFNNAIHKAPDEDDWKGEIVLGIQLKEQEDWMITQGNKLYYAANHDYHYEYYCDLSTYSAGNYYVGAIEIDDRIYVCPADAQNILVLKEHKIIKRVELTRFIEDSGAFTNVWYTGSYLFLIPFRYPAIVRYDVERDQIDYLEGYQEIYEQYTDKEWRAGVSCLWKNYLLIAEPKGNRVLAVNVDTLKTNVIARKDKAEEGCLTLITQGDFVWILPIDGTTITCWNPQTGTETVYKNTVEDFRCIYLKYSDMNSNKKPFGSMAFYEDKAILSPYWGNMFIELNVTTGVMREWKQPLAATYEGKNDYYACGATGYFLLDSYDKTYEWCQYFYFPERKLYDINLRTGGIREKEISFSIDELRQNEPGYSEQSEWLMYACKENVFNTLPNLLEGKVYGKQFNKKKQIEAYQKIAANNDGTCGEKIHQFATEHLISST